MQDDPDLDTAAPTRLARRRRQERRPVEEAGGGVSEGFEQAEDELIEHASHADQHGTTRIMRDVRHEREDAGETHGEPDAEHRADL